jgi:hypothetical protein
MSSPPPPQNSPYQSKFLSFLNRQYIRLNDRLGKGLRQTTLILKNGLQTVLYPFYVITQLGRMIGRQLQGSSKQGVFHLNQGNSEDSTQSLSLPNPDEPIEKILDLLTAEILSNQSLESILPTITNQPVEIQSIATTLENHHLVLVTTNNQIVDLLSPKQQKQLQSLIRNLRANYWDKKRVAIQKYQEVIYNFPYFYTPPSPQITFKYLWWELMRWLQKSPLAMSLNLFKESQIIKLEESYIVAEINNSNPYPSSSSLQLLTKLDQGLAKWEHRYLPLDNPPITPVDNYGSTLNSLGNIDYFNPLNIIQETKQNSPRFNLNLSNNITKINKGDPFELKVLIWAAIDYFFKEKPPYFPLVNTNKINEDTQLINGLPLINEVSNTPNSSLIIDNNNWLSWEDLYEVTQELKQIEQENNLIVEENITTEEEQLLLISSEDLVNQEEELLTPQEEPQQEILTTNIENNLTEKVTITPPNSQPVITKITPKPKPKKLAIVKQKQKSVTSPKNQRVIETKKQTQTLPTVTTNPPKLSLNTTPELDIKSSVTTQNKGVKSKSLEVKLNVNLENNDNLKQKSALISLEVKTSKSENPGRNKTVNKENKVEERDLDWLEIQAKDLGYEKHFLQTILELLDLVILWVEKILTKIWNWLRKN